MAKKAYASTDGVARAGKAVYIGIDGVARKVKRAYVGVDDIARIWWDRSGLILKKGSLKVDSGKTTAVNLGEKPEYLFLEGTQPIAAVYPPSDTAGLIAAFGKSGKCLYTGRYGASTKVEGLGNVVKYAESGFSITGQQNTSVIPSTLYYYAFIKNGSATTYFQAKSGTVKLNINSVTINVGFRPSYVGIYSANGSNFAMFDSGRNSTFLIDVSGGETRAGKASELCKITNTGIVIDTSLIKGTTIRTPDGDFVTLDYSDALNGKTANYIIMGAKK